MIIVTDATYVTGATVLKKVSECGLVHIFIKTRDQKDVPDFKF